jgi:hypothetical protein
MADFNDSIDSELGAACNRLAAFTLPIPEGALVDEASGLTEPDLIRILRALHSTRLHSSIEVISMEEAGRRYKPGSGGDYSADLTLWSDEQLLTVWRGSTGEPGDPIADRLAAEIERRNLDI